ncbi:hypothetical protein [Planctomicrobium piriforme]|uniref:Uncharacterized protein n=1 Tax=Planctomicrobium piriforme TaxID=1576369 RepID=A0A1I3TA92_9PLAN|nr:hypothetical protein [Planctomicrobium piriforme]SFJ66586.1 hypothetical protein SAMN05421753_1287 [Planctomicrobium piriforme]
MLRASTLLALFILMNGCATVFSEPNVATSTPQHCPPEKLAALPPGARVKIFETSSTEFTRFTFGTVLKSAPEGIVLINCDRRTQGTIGVPIVSKVPHFNRLYKNTGIGAERLPVLWIPVSEVATAHVIEPAPADYVPPHIDIEMTDDPFVEMVGVDFEFSTGQAVLSKTNSSDPSAGSSRASSP